MRFLAFLAALLLGGAGSALAQTPTTFQALKANAITLPNCLGYLYGNASTAANCTPTFVAPSAAPSSLATWDSLANAFAGDNSKIIAGIKYSITGAASLGLPATGYRYTDELTPSVIWMMNQSGWNQQTATNDGRTAATATRVHVYNHGQGDMMAFNATGFVDTARAGATSFLANPAVGLFGGDVSAGANGVYLNPYETIIADNGFDVAAIGVVTNISRTNDTGALGVVHIGVRPQSQGTKAVDALYSGAGPTKIGLDLTGVTLNASGNWTKAAVTIKADDRVYFNATVPAAQPGYSGFTNQDYIGYSSGTSSINTVVGNNATLQVYVGAVGIQGALAFTGHVSSTGSAATVSSCGTTPSISGTDTRGTVTIGSGTVTACTVNFATAYGTAPFCTVSAQTTSLTVGISPPIGTSNFVINSSANMAGQKITYICLG